MVEVDEWLEMSQEDFASYRTAVADGNFMAMRRAAMMHSAKSVKLQRLREIVGEAEDNGRRVVVFSYFLDALSQVVSVLPGRVFGPLTGAVPAANRQKMIDDFSAAKHGAVLVAQISAGGVGLNIQAASVVIICEPQLKPTTEWQAIARAQRMGQVQSVQVHRLLSEEGVDERLCRLLERKSELFEEFARRGEIAEAAPEAYDVSEAELARQVIAAERERLFGQRVSEAAAAGSGELEPAKSRRPKRQGGETVHNGRIPTRELSPNLSAHNRSCHSQGESADTANDARGVAGLPLYVAFGGTYPRLVDTPTDRVVDNIEGIVAVEGPILGFRLHQVYREASGDPESREVSRMLNRAIQRAENDGRIISDNPLGADGIKPKTFRLEGQPSVVPRQLGPRSAAHVPPAEREYHSRAGEGR